MNTSNETLSSVGDGADEERAGGASASAVRGPPLPPWPVPLRLQRVQRRGRVFGRLGRSPVPLRALRVNCVVWIRTRFRTRCRGCRVLIRTCRDLLHTLRPV